MFHVFNNKINKLDNKKKILKATNTFKRISLTMYQICDHMGKIENVDHLNVDHFPGQLTLYL